MMKKIPFALFLLMLLWTTAVSAAPDQYIYDEADVLTDAEEARLEELAKKYSDKRGIAFIVLTTNNTNGLSIESFRNQFVNNNPVGYEAALGNTAIITVDFDPMKRDVNVGSVGDKNVNLSVARLDKIRYKVTPYLTSGEYEKAFETFIKEAQYYSQFGPNFNPDNIFYKWWFQLVLGFALAGIIVGIMIATRGGKVTTNSSTYIDSDHSGVTNARDTYVTTKISKVRKPKNNGGGGPGGGFAAGSFGGGGGRSFNSSSGKF